MVMRIAIVLLLAACEHEPPPRAAPPALVPVAPAIDAAAEIAVAPPDASATIDDAMCKTIAEHVTTILVDKDSSARRTDAQRELIRQRLAASCRSERWSASGIECLRAARTAVEVKKCDHILHPRPAP